MNIKFIALIILNCSLIGYGIAIKDTLCIVANFMAIALWVVLWCLED